MGRTASDAYHISISDFNPTLQEVRISGLFHSLLASNFPSLVRRFSWLFSKVPVDKFMERSGGFKLLGESEAPQEKRANDIKECKGLKVLR